MSSGKNRSQEAELYRNMYSLLRMMCNNAPDLIWAKDLEGRYLFANQAICDVLLNARDTDEPIGKTDLYFACREREEHPEEPEWHTFGEVCVDSDQVVLASRQAGRFDEFGNVRGKFLRLDVNKVPFFDADGDLIGTVGCGRDVTKEKEMEMALRQCEARYRLIAENTDDVIWTMDLATGRYTFFSPSVEKLGGYSVEEALQLSWDKLLAPETVPIARKRLNERLQKFAAGDLSQQVGRSEYDHICKDGSIIPVEMSTTLLTDVSGKVTTLLGVSRNISERKRAETDLRERQQRIDQELKLARALQKATLPDFPQMPGVNVRTVYEAVGAVSGDIYLLEWVVPGEVFRGYIVDVIGHDIAAALVTSTMSVLLHEAAEMRVSLADQLDWLHCRTLKSFPEDFFVAVAAIEVDLGARRLRYATAGINQFWHSRGGEVERIAAPSLFLSMTEHPDLCVGEIELQPGDMFYFPTDGLTDLMRQDETDCFADFELSTGSRQLFGLLPGVRAIDMAGDMQ